ncbi:hypothetical protein [Variovorax terrae]|uniref:Uncharacterized protein n=1 Tax=Variovorax terrae TaxID=2923278 RepID=A0A9X1VR79_9BURK|nr:hypothetical protein [Variovorax terrae]MCJ0762346.1 hypothetical protein [Variovorax terrae]
MMRSDGYRIESNQPLRNHLLPPPMLHGLYKDPSLAVAVAVKSVLNPSTQEVRVIHVPSGEVVFRSTAADARRPPSPASGPEPA